MIFSGRGTKSHTFKIVLGKYSREKTAAPYSTPCPLELAGCLQFSYCPLFCDSSGCDL